MLATSTVLDHLIANAQRGPQQTTLRIETKNPDLQHLLFINQIR